MLSTGGNWGLMQSITWLKMTLKFTQDYSWSASVQKSLNGENPCDVCKWIIDKKKDQKDQDLIKYELKILANLKEQATFLKPPIIQLDFGDPILPFSPFPHSPPSPPPRLA